MRAVVVVLLAATFTGCPRTPPTEPPVTGNTAPPATMSPTDVTVDRDGVVHLGDTRLSERPTDTEVFAILGQASRLEALANDIFVYDPLGIAVYRVPETHTITQISFFFAREDDFSFMPLTLFSGSLVVDGTAISAALPRKYAPGTGEDGPDPSTKLAAGDLTIYFSYEDGGLRSVEVSYPD